MTEKNNNEKKILGVIIIALLIGGAYIGYTAFIKEDVVGPNDIVEINYIVWIEESGKVFATTIVNEYNITKDTLLDDSHRYRPLDITIGPSPPSKGTVQVIEGLEEGLLGMKRGDIKEITIPPEKGYQPDPELIIEISRTFATFDKEQVTPAIQTTSRTLALTHAQFSETYGKNAEIGDIVQLPDWNGTVTDMDNDNVYIRGDPEVGQIIKTKPWDMEIIEVTDNNITLKQNAVEGNTYENAYGNIFVETVTETDITFIQVELLDQIETVYGPADLIDNGDTFDIFINPEEGKTVVTQNGTGVITNITETTFSLDFNPSFVGKTIVYKVKIEKIIKAEN
ncbi:MAG: FKBP-type peptidyl-prolyl cis-trans isomerase [Candidatus Methanofastidiosia archaeon]